MSQKSMLARSNRLFENTALNLIYGFIIVIGLSFLVCSMRFPNLRWDVQGNVISDFGAYGSTAPIFNGSLVLAGIFNLVFIVSALQKLGFKVVQLTSIVFIISALCLCFVGLAPLPNDTDLFSLPRIIHWTFATIYFLLEPLGITFFALRVKNKYPLFSRWSLVLCLFTVVATLGNVLFVSKILSEFSHTFLILWWKLRLRALAKTAI